MELRSRKKCNSQDSQDSIHNLVHIGVGTTVSPTRSRAKVQSRSPDRVSFKELGDSEESSPEIKPNAISKLLTLKTITKLSGPGDYTIWKDGIETFFELQNLSKFIRKDWKDPKYNLSNKAVKSMIMQTISKEYAQNIAHYGSAYQAMQYLETKILGAREVQLQEVQEKLYSIRYKTLQQFLDKFRSLASKLQELDKNTSVHHLCCLFLKQLLEKCFRVKQDILMECRDKRTLQYRSLDRMVKVLINRVPHEWLTSGNLCDSHKNESRKTVSAALESKEP